MWAKASFGVFNPAMCDERRGDFTPLGLLGKGKFTELEDEAKTPEAQAKSAEIDKQLKAIRVQQAEREVEAMFGSDGGATFVEGRFKSPITVTDAPLPFLVPRLHAAVEIEFSARVTNISTIGVGCPELTSLKM